MKIVRLLFGVLLLLPATNAHAVIRSVHQDGISGDHATIQAAIDASSDGDVVELLDGIFTGTGNRDLDFGGRDIILRSRSGDPTACVLDCEGSSDDPHRAFHFHSGEDYTASLVGVTIRNGYANLGGAVLLEGGTLQNQTAPTIVSVIFENNTATTSGGAVYARDYGGGLIANSILRNNHSDGDCGALYALRGMGFYNNLVVDNTAGSSPIAINNTSNKFSTFSNPADYGFYEIDGGLDHCIVDGGAIIAGQGSVNYTCFRIGDFPSGVGNLSNTNPDFTTGPGGDYYLASDSPCVDAGQWDITYSAFHFRTEAGDVPMSHLTTQSTELRDSGLADIGFHYRHFNPVLIGTHYATIQEALDACLSGESIEVPGGTWYENLNFVGKTVVVRSSGGALATAINGGSAGPVVSFLTREGPGSVLDGFTLTNGLGGADGGGGALCYGDVWPTLQNDRIFLNSAALGGGVSCVRGAGIDVRNCMIQSNTGGGLRFWLNRGALVTGSTIIDNTATNGAAVYVIGGSVDIESTTINDNTATDRGSAIHAGQGSIVDVDRTIITFNQGTYGIYGSESTVNLSCSDVFFNLGGDFGGSVPDQIGINGNISADPQYCSEATGDLTLEASSPCRLAPGCGQIGAWGATCGIGSLTWLVRPDGTGDATTIQEAIDLSLPGEIVELADGTFTGDGNREIEFRGKAITVRSQNGDPTLCIVDCEGSAAEPHRGFRFISGEGLGSILRDITIRNAYTTSSGGGVQCAGASPRIENCHFLDGEAGDSGAGVSLSLSSALIRSCWFEGNLAANAGGAIHMNTATPTIEGCVLVDNWANWGAGGIHVYISQPTIRTTSFDGNESAHWGGGLHADNAATAFLVEDCYFFDNTAPEGGAIFVRRDADVQVNDTVLGNNEALTGDAVLCKTGSSIALHHCTLGNNGVDAGYGVSLDEASASFQYSIAWANGGPGGIQFRLVNSSSMLVSCAAVQDGQSGVTADGTSNLTWLAGNIPDDPRFCSPASNDFHLRGDSPCAAANNPTCGQIGALGTGCTQPYMVQPDGSGDFATIQEAVDGVLDDEIIQLGVGTFAGPSNVDVDFGGKRVRIVGTRSTSKVDGKTSLLTVIDCGGSASTPHRAFLFQSGEGADTILEDLVIENGYTTDSGGAIRCTDSSSPTLRGCEFRNNVSGDDGGALYAFDNSSPVLEDCSFHDNSAADRGGAAAFAVNSFPDISDCEFTANDALEGGGLAFVYAYGPMTGCAVYDNTAARGGGIFLHGNGRITLTRCTLNGNEATSEGGGIFCRNNSDPTVHASIISYSSAGEAIWCDGDSEPVISCSNLVGNAGGDWVGYVAPQAGISGNMSAAPLYCNAATGDLHLLDGSPCLAANNSCSEQIGAYGLGCVPVRVPELPVMPRFLVHQNHPNPFNPATVVEFELDRAQRVRVAIFDLRGREIAVLEDAGLDAGPHRRVWRGEDAQGAPVASGIYLLEVRGESQSAKKKMVLLR